MNGAPGSPASNSSTGSATPFSRQCPCDTTRCATGPSASRAAPVINVWPPRATDITRAASDLFDPSTSTGLAPHSTSACAFERTITAPTCRPARAHSGGSMRPSMR